MWRYYPYIQTSKDVESKPPPYNGQKTALPHDHQMSKTYLDCLKGNHCRYYDARTTRQTPKSYYRRRDYELGSQRQKSAIWSSKKHDKIAKFPDGYHPTIRGFQYDENLMDVKSPYLFKSPYSLANNINHLSPNAIGEQRFMSFFATSNEKGMHEGLSNNCGLGTQHSSVLNCTRDSKSPEVSFIKEEKGGLVYDYNANAMNSTIANYQYEQFLSSSQMPTYQNYIVEYLRRSIDGFYPLDQQHVALSNPNEIGPQPNVHQRSLFLQSKQSSKPLPQHVLPHMQKDNVSKKQDNYQNSIDNHSEMARQRSRYLDRIYSDYAYNQLIPENNVKLGSIDKKRNKREDEALKDDGQTSSLNSQTNMQDYTCPRNAHSNTASSMIVSPKHLESSLSLKTAVLQDEPEDLSFKRTAEKSQDIISSCLEDTLIPGATFKQETKDIPNDYDNEKFNAILEELLYGKILSPTQEPVNPIIDDARSLIDVFPFDKAQLPLEQLHQGKKDTSMLPVTGNGPISKDQPYTLVNSPATNRHTFGNATDLLQGNGKTQNEEGLEHARGTQRSKDAIFRDPPETSVPFNGPNKFRFYCMVCDTGFTRTYTFSRHRCKGRVDKHRCHLCDKAYLSKYKLRDHILVKHEGQSFSCPVCGKQFCSRASMLLHKKQQHEGKYATICKICGKGFNHSGHYYGHMNKHNNIKPFWCQMCGKRFYGSCFLHYHRQVCRNNRDMNVACTVCDRKFKCKLYLQRHMKVHLKTTNDVKSNVSLSMDVSNGFA